MFRLLHIEVESVPKQMGFSRKGFGNIASGCAHSVGLLWVWNRRGFLSHERLEACMKHMPALAGFVLDHLFLDLFWLQNKYPFKNIDIPQGYPFVFPSKTRAGPAVALPIRSGPCFLARLFLEIEGTSRPKRPGWKLRRRLDGQDTMEQATQAASMLDMTCAPGHVEVPKMPRSSHLWEGPTDRTRGQLDPEPGARNPSSNPSPH